MLRDNYKKKKVPLLKNALTFISTVFISAKECQFFFSFIVGISSSHQWKILCHLMENS